MLSAEGQSTLATRAVLRALLFHFQLETLDFVHHDVLADADSRPGVRVPQLALDEDLAFRIDVGARFTHRADHALQSGHDFAASRPEGNGHQEDRDDSERHAHPKRRPELHPHLRNWAIHQQQPTQREQNYPAEAEAAGFAGPPGYVPRKRPASLRPRNPCPSHPPSGAKLRWRRASRDQWRRCARATPAGLRRSDPGAPGKIARRWRW